MNFFLPIQSNKRQNGWTDRAHILCGTSHDLREGLRMLKITKMCPKVFLDFFVKFWKNVRKNIIKSANFFFLLILLRRCSQIESQLTIGREDGYLILMSRRAETIKADSACISFRTCSSCSAVMISSPLSWTISQSSQRPIWPIKHPGG